MIQYYIALVWTKIRFEGFSGTNRRFFSEKRLEKGSLRAKIYLKFYIGFRALVLSLSVPDRCCEYAR